MLALTINGAEIKQPISLQVDKIDLSSSESGEDLSGYTHKDVIRKKRKISCSWGTLTWADASSLLAAVDSGANISVTYPDPYSGKFETRIFYVGDRTCPCARVREDGVWWSGISFNLVEHGGDTP